VEDSKSLPYRDIAIRYDWAFEFPADDLGRIQGITRGSDGGIQSLSAPGQNEVAFSAFH